MDTMSQATDGFGRDDAQANERAALEALINYVADMGSGAQGRDRHGQADALRRSLRDVLDPKFS
ncbi:hypothetical protein [Tritonibacter multivorans]|nr:hypothetical protein [Tritonibacter multivorans]